MLYSVRMRAAQGGAHELGGRHISGAERIVQQTQVSQVVDEMLSRSLSHTRGQADFVNITVEALDEDAVLKVPLLPVNTMEVPDVAAGREAALATLVKAGVNNDAARQGIEYLSTLSDSMHGAMLVCAVSGKRLDEGQRGIRVSRMDISDEEAFNFFLQRHGLAGNIHAREALVLASKVAFAREIAAELCWSDDPEYTAGYVASKAGYVRFPYLKMYGSAVGGRIFFVQPDADLAVLHEYLERQPVLVESPTIA